MSLGNIDSAAKPLMRIRKIAFSFPVLLFALASGSYGQSLGDVARQQRRQQQTKNPSLAPKVVTNDEIPESPDASSSEDTDAGSESFAPAPAARKKSAEQWKAEIRTREARIAAMQSQVDRLNASDHFVEANRYSNGAQFNQYQLKRQQEAQRLQKQEEVEKKQLEDARDSARKSGFGTAVYDPSN
jgi:hypothetical protein